LIHGLAAVVTVSPATATKFREEFPQQQERIHCVANATAGDRPDAPSVALVEKSRAAISIPAEPFLVAVGHLRRRKGLELVLQALARLSEKPCQLLVIGEGPERRPLQQLARKLGVATQVCFLGPLDDPSVDTLLQRATGLLFPSRLEGFGFPVFEALARSCPVVATPLPPWEKWCGPGLTCVQRDADCWAQALAELLEDPAAAREGALQLGRRLRSGTWKLAAEQLRDLYTSLLSPRAL
jgi:glycosyltransferase involved in cell wall biosynthesis